MFRRKASEPSAPEPEEAILEPGGSAVGPFDAAEVSDDLERLDLGALKLVLAEGVELRLQVDEATQAVQAVMLARDDGAVELRPFAAARHSDLWAAVRADLTEDLTRSGVHPVEREGSFGTEIHCELPVTLPGGKTGAQATRFTGVNGPRWLLRATFVGVPALDPERAREWEELVRAVVVDRGAAAMPPGDPLPLTLPPGARRAE